MEHRTARHGSIVGDVNGDDDGGMVGPVGGGGKVGVVVDTRVGCRVVGIEVGDPVPSQTSPSHPSGHTQM